MGAVEKAVQTDGHKLMQCVFLSRRPARRCGRAVVLTGVAAVLVGAMSAPAALANGVTSLSQGPGVALSPNPITSTGTISLALPLSLSLSAPSQLFSLTNTSTATGSGGLRAQGQTFGVGGSAATGEGVFGSGTTDAIGVFGTGGGPLAGVEGEGGLSAGPGGLFDGGASGTAGQASGSGVIAKGAPANPVQTGHQGTFGGAGIEAVGGNDSQPRSGDVGGDAGAGIVALGGAGTNSDDGGDGIDATAGPGPGALAGRFTGNVVVSGTLSAGQLVAPLSWQPLSLLNNWSGGPSGTATPAVALDGEGIVHFRGAMAESGTFNATAFVLPARFRPAHTVFIAVDTVNATTGRLQIDNNGTVLVQDTAGGSNARTFTSLDGATYSLG
jgi:hypothetical protein